MHILALLHFFAFLVYLCLAVFVLYKNPKAAINRASFMLILCFVIWSFSSIWMNDMYGPESRIRLATNLGSLGWASWPSFILLFYFIFTEKEKILKKKITYILLFSPAVLFIYQQWKGLIIADYLRQPYGWSYTWSKSIWPPLFFSYYLSCTIASLFIYFDFLKKTNRRGAQMSRVAFITTPISTALASISNVVLPWLNIHRYPLLGDVLSIVWIIGLVHSIIKYGFMITPQFAADKILATISDSLILIEPDGKIATFNQATLGLLGYNKKEDLRGKLITTVLSEYVYTGIYRELAEKERVLNYETVYLSSSGTEIPVDLAMSTLKNYTGQFVGIVCIAKDMREIRRLLQKEKELAVTAAAAEVEKRRSAELEKLNQDLKEAQAQLVQSAKMAVVGQLGAGVAHELNNPLGGILGYAQFMLEKLKKPEFSPEDFQSCAKYIESIERESTRCKGIVETLLKFSRRPLSIKPEPVDVALAINETLAIIGHQLKLKNVNVVTDFQPALAQVMGIANQLQQVFTNIILNAQQAMPEGGQLKIAAKNIADTHKVEIEFTDTGCGISEENLLHIFEPFFTTKQKDKGTGLGLSVSYQIIQEYKGNIEVKSQLDKGTTVIVSLPVGIKEQR